MPSLAREVTAKGEKVKKAKKGEVPQPTLATILNSLPSTSCEPIRLSVKDSVKAPNGISVKRVNGTPRPAEEILERSKELPIVPPKSRSSSMKRVSSFASNIISYPDIRQWASMTVQPRIIIFNLSNCRKRGRIEWRSQRMPRENRIPP